jgi:hypothetical protein
MCKCDNFCPKCDPGIEAFYQEKVKEAKAAADAHFLATGIKIEDYRDFLDADDIWYEYCELKKVSQVEDATDTDVPDEMYEPDNTWKI